MNLSHFKPHCNFRAPLKKEILLKILLYLYTLSFIISYSLILGKNTCE